MDFEDKLEEAVVAAMEAVGLDPDMMPDTADTIRDALRPILENVLEEGDPDMDMGMED